VEFPTNTAPFRRKHREIEGSTYETFEAFTSVSQQDNFMDRVFFPIKNIQNRVVAFIGRCSRGDNSRKSKYYIYPSKAPLPLYPSIFPERPNSIILVEGIFDMLNLHDKGVSNAACIFGVDTMANTLSEHLMPIKAQNISKVYLLLDGDIAGRTAAKKLKPLIEAEGFYCEIVELPDGADPGDMDQEAVSTLKEYINE
jgi:DNA primase